MLSNEGYNIKYGSRTIVNFIDPTFCEGDLMTQTNTLISCNATCIIRYLGHIIVSIANN